jgi:hypothetical protein
VSWFGWVPNNGRMPNRPSFPSRILILNPLPVSIVSLAHVLPKAPQAKQDKAKKTKRSDCRVKVKTVLTPGHCGCQRRGKVGFLQRHFFARRKRSGIQRWQSSGNAGRLSRGD